MIPALIKQASGGERRFGRDVVWNLGSLAVLGASGIVINIVIAGLRGPEALGVFNQLFAFYIVLSQLAVGGLQFSALQQVSYHQHDLRACSRVACAALILVAAVAAAVCLVALAGRELAAGLLDSPQVAAGIAFALPGLFLYALNKVLINVLNGLRHMRAYAIFQSLRFVFILASIVGLIRADAPAERLPLALSIAEAALFVSLMLYIHLRLFALVPGRGTAAWFRPHLSYGLRGVLSGIVHEINTRVDVLVLGFFLDDATVGLYSFAAVIAEGFGQLAVAVRWNVDPLIGRCFAEHRRSDIEVLARRIRRVFWPAAAGVGLLAVLGYPVLLAVFMPGAGFGDSWSVFAILVAALAFNAGWRPFMGLLLQSGRPGMHTLLVLGVAVCNLVLNILFVPVLGMQGSAAATGLAYMLEAGLISVFARRVLGIRV